MLHGPGPLQMEEWARQLGRSQRQTQEVAGLAEALDADPLGSADVDADGDSQASGSQGAPACEARHPLRCQ